MDKKPPLPSKNISFLYKGADKNGKNVQGTIQAPSKIMAKALLIAQDIRPHSIKKEYAFMLFKKSIQPSDIAQFTRQIDTMLGAGVPLIQSLDILIRGTDHTSMKMLLSQIKQAIESGLPLSEALRQHPEQFDNLFCGLVAAGESSGSLEAILNRIATYKEKTESLKKKIKKALFYPTAICIVACIVTIILLVYVVPQFESLFKGFGAELPAFTQIVINASRFVQNQWWFVLICFIAFIVMIKHLKKNSALFNRFLDKISLHLPVIGPILYKAIIARYTRTLSTIFAAGVPLIEALSSIAATTGNIFYTEGVYAIRDEVAQGSALYVAMRRTHLFPMMVIQMVEIGEEAGALETMLAKVASIYEEEVDTAVDALSSLLEPIIMVVLGVLVGGLVVAMYLPIFKMGSVV